MNRLVIAHNFSSFSYADSSRQLAILLANQGHEVLFISHQPVFKPAFHPQPGLQVTSWNTNRPDQANAVVQAIRWINAFKPHAVLAHSAATNAILVAAWLCRVPVRLAYYHSAYEANKMDNPATGMKERLLRWRKKIIYRMATQVVCVSEFARGDAQYWFDIPLRKSVCVYNSLELNPAIKLPAKTQQQFAYGSLNRLEPCKLLPELIDAFQEFAVKNHHHPTLTLAGDGSLKQQIKSKIAQTPCASYAGGLPYDEIGQFIHQQDFILFSTIADAFGMVIIECYRWGTVPIAAAKGAIPELIEDGITGFLVPGKYGQTWTDVLDYSTKVAPGTDAYQRMVNAGWRKLHQLFNRKHQLELLSHLILARNT